MSDLCTLASSNSKIKSPAATNLKMWPGLLYLFVVYIAWGSTYLAVRVAVRGDNSFPPFILTSSRLLISGIILITMSAIRGENLKPTRRDLITLILTSVFLWIIASGSLVWAQQVIDSGFASLLGAMIPFWMVIIETVMTRRLPTLQMFLAFLIGFGGIGVLIYPTLIRGVPTEVFPIILLVFGGLSWSSGSVLLKYRSIDLSLLASTGYQHLIGAIGLSVLAMISGERWVYPGLDSWLAWGYLLVFGSLLGFIAYEKALKLLPMKIVATYAYINPVIAIILGWIVFKEQITPWTIWGAALVFMSVALIFRERERILH